MRSASWRRGGPWALLVPLVALGAGLLIATTASTAAGTDLRASRSEQLSQLVLDRQREIAQLSTRLVTLRERLAEQARLAGAGDAAVRAARAQGTALAPLAGLTPVSGSGVSVALSDAPAPPAGQTLPGNPDPDLLLVHQQDVQAVVNALWAGGARGMTIMGQRVIATTAVRCVGNTLLLLGRVYSPPFSITAVGDPTRLRRALDASPDVTTYREYADAYGLGYDVSVHRTLRLPGYTGPLDLTYAKPAGGAA